MRRLFSDMNPTLRGLLVVALIALVVVVFQLQQTLTVVSLLLYLAFVLAIAFFIYLLWRERRDEISTWSTRAKTTFYGAALVIVADVGVLIYKRPAGPELLALFVALGLAVFAMVRVWRDQHRYTL